MGLIRKLKGNKGNEGGSQSGGPEEWARKAREVDEEIKRQRALEAVGNKAVHSFPGEEPLAEQREDRKHFSDVEELSGDYLRHLYKLGAHRGRYIRLGDAVFVSPGNIPGHEGVGLMHKEILERALKKPGVKERVLSAEAIQGPSEETIGPDGLTDAGKFDVFFLPENEPREDGIQGRFRIFGSSASFSMANKDGREKTVQIATQVLGQHIRAEEASHMGFS